jgi:hypothetical protein
MGRKLEWELSGKSDVPEKMAKAKASMEGLEGASNALGKKFKEAFKDIALGFVAPMVLVQKALSFMTDQFEKLRQFAQESREFAKDAENAKYFRPGGREAILQQEAREKESEAKMKGAFGSQLGYADFLANDPRGKELMKQFGFRAMPPSVGALGNIIPGGNAVAGAVIGRGQEKAAAQALALRDDVRAQIDALLAGDIAKRSAAAASGAADGGMTASKIPELASNVIGVGMSPQLDIANKQLVVQEDMANSLRELIERDKAQTGFTPEKFFPSSRRLNLPR